MDRFGAVSLSLFDYELVFHHINLSQQPLPRRHHSRLRGQRQLGKARLMQGDEGAACFGENGG